MIKIWLEYSNFQTTSQRLADQVRTIIEKGWFSELQVIEIQLKKKDQHGNNTQPDTWNIYKQKQLNRNEPTISENRTPLNQTLNNQTTYNKHFHGNKT